MSASAHLPLVLTRAANTYISGASSGGECCDAIWDNSNFIACFNSCLIISKLHLKEAIKIELSQIASQHSPPVEAPDIQVLVTRVSTKGSCVEANTNPLGKEPSDVHVDNMGLYVVGD